MEDRGRGYGVEGQSIRRGGAEDTEGRGRGYGGRGQARVMDKLEFNVYTTGCSFTADKAPPQLYSPPTQLTRPGGRDTHTPATLIRGVHITNTHTHLHPHIQIIYIHSHTGTNTHSKGTEKL